jgi:hypothetical protein
MEPQEIKEGTPALYSIGSDDWSGRIVEILRNGRTLVWLGSRHEDTPENRKRAAEKFTRRKDGRYFLEGKKYGELHVGDASPTSLAREF